MEMGSKQAVGCLIWRWVCFGRIGGPALNVLPDDHKRLCVLYLQSFKQLLSFQQGHSQSTDEKLHQLRHDLREIEEKISSLEMQIHSRGGRGGIITPYPRPLTAPRFTVELSLEVSGLLKVKRLKGYTSTHYHPSFR